ncbi:MAG: gamma-glutamyltransferase [Acidobacteria bacterium]|nr:gamma-glutamyltransferase [Acidobacteriota bacterium]
MHSPSIPAGDRPAGNIRGTRSPAVGRDGMIATSQSLASAAGLRVLMDGGTAVDAAVTAAGVLAVVEPSMNGPGGDLFAIVFDGRTGTLTGLDSCGASGAACTPELFARRGLREMPLGGPLPVTVPGVVEGWHQLLTKFGTRSLGDCLAPAIRYAADGFPVQELAAAEWHAAAPRLAEDAAAARTFLPDGRAPRHGERFANPRLARTLDAVATGGRDAFYRGAIAEAIVADLAARDGLLTLDDFAAHEAAWVDPIRSTYRGVEIAEMPPSTQGFVALEMLNLLEGFDIAGMGHLSADHLHVTTEAKRLAFADRAAYLADRRRVPAARLAQLISKPYAETRRGDIDMRRSSAFAPAGDFAGRDLGDTIYLTVADRHGTVVSFIQSIFASFGAGIVAGDTGVTLHNRGCGFTFEESHPNQVAPRQRPLHTLVPAMLLKDGRPWVSFGVMGGDNQAQAHAQVVCNLVDFGMHIQQAGEAARMRHQGTTLALESGIAPDVRDELSRRGHEVIDGRGAMGGFQGIMLDHAAGVMLGGSDVRKDGLAIGF